MRIAYLILAHDSPCHLKRLTQALNDFDDHIFIHINKKTDTQLFQEVAQQQHVSMISNRVTIHWGGFSMVHATLNLLHAARNHPLYFQHYCFISGSDYPIRNNQYIHNYFEHHNQYEFIDIIDAYQRDKTASLPRLEHFVFELGLTRKTLLKVLLFQLNHKILRSKLLARDYQTYLGGLQPYFGDAWWVLSERAVSYIFKFIETHPRLVNFYRHTTHPLEMFFQTIIGNSPFSDYVSHNVTYTDWLPQANSPCFLNDDHIGYLETQFRQSELAPGQKEFLFARKFSEDRQDLTYRVDQNLRGVHAGQMMPNVMALTS